MLYNSEPREGLPRLDKNQINGEVPASPQLELNLYLVLLAHRHASGSSTSIQMITGDWMKTCVDQLDFSPSCWNGNRSSCPRVCVISISFAYVNRPPLWVCGCTERGLRLVVRQPIGAREPSGPAPSDTLLWEKLHAQSTGCGRCLGDRTLHVSRISCSLDRQSCRSHRRTKEEERAAASCGTVGDLHHHLHLYTDRQERLGQEDVAASLKTDETL